MRTVRRDTLFSVGARQAITGDQIMHQKTRALSNLLLILIAGSGSAALQARSDIATWIDDDGVTHFGNPQFAPPNSHTVVTVHPANTMVATQAPAHTGNTASGPRVVTLNRGKQKNKRGFRGYAARSTMSQGRSTR